MLAKSRFFVFGTEGAPHVKQPPDKALVGGKGAGLITMANAGFKVPPGLVVGTDVYAAYRESQIGLWNQAFTEELLAELQETLINDVGLDQATDLVSVRSGAPVSMPGMMDTVLNVKIDFASLRVAVRKVFDSWMSPRAIEYRKEFGISDGWGTAVVIQKMVDGSKNENSCTGVMFSRDPATGENLVVGEFLPQAQGEALVSGAVTPLPLCEMVNWNQQALDELLDIAGRLELLYREVQDIEFTIEDGEVYVLQTRDAKLTSLAKFITGHDLVLSRYIDRGAAIERVTSADYRAVASPTASDSEELPEPDCSGLGASPGIVMGQISLSSAQVLDRGAGQILVTATTSPEDFEGMAKAEGILTLTGGMTCHSAVVARAMNKPAVVGAEKLGAHMMTYIELSDGSILRDQDRVAIDGSTGRIWINPFDVEGFTKQDERSLLPEVLQVLNWAAQEKNMYPVYRVTKDLSSVPDKGRVYVDLSNVSGKKELSKIFTELKKRPELFGVLGFVGSGESFFDLDDVSKHFLNILRGDTKSKAGGYWSSVAVELLNRKSFSKKFRSSWIIHLSGRKHSMELDPKWRQVMQIETLSDISRAASVGGLITFPDTDLSLLPDMTPSEFIQPLKGLGLGLYGGAFEVAELPSRSLNAA